MAYVSVALGCQPAPTVPERRCASCGVLACQPDGVPWRNSIRLIDGQRVTVCEMCADGGPARGIPHPAPTRPAMARRTLGRPIGGPLTSLA